MRFIRFMQGNLPEDREKKREQILKDIFGEEEWQVLKRRRQPELSKQDSESDDTDDRHQKKLEAHNEVFPEKKSLTDQQEVFSKENNGLQPEVEEAQLAEEDSPAYFIKKKGETFSKVEPQADAESLNEQKTLSEKEEAKSTNSISSYEAPRTHEEILDKNTHYIFIFGYTGSGKSTVLTAINMYMRQHYRVILNQMENQEGIRLVHEMMRGMEEGQFPQPTSIGTITEYDTAFSINGQTVNLTFLEMAGEDLKKIDVETGDEGLDPHVQSFLSCPGISISFLIVADYNRVMTRREDKLILQFLSYLYNEGIDMSRVGVILSKFDRDKTTLPVEEVIQKYLPQVDKWLTSGDIRQPRIFPFSVGEVRSSESQKDEIVKMNLTDCSEIVPWLHKVLSLPDAPNPAPKPKSGIGRRLRSLFNF